MRDLRRVVAVLAGATLALAACGGGADDAGDARHTATDAASPSTEALPSGPIEAFDGGTVRFADYVGTPLVVNFWASWCPPCIAEMPDLEEVHQLAGDRLTFIGINTQDTPDAAEDLVEQTGVTYDLVRDPDGELFRELGVFGMPTTFFVDASGDVVGRHTGLLTRDALVEEIHDQLGIDIDATT
ncbi:MAG: TlpA family protein disulfide reductase [Actinobacteria bacterium]|nr:TlpA family protein disulfide reductase [Actinomycetota bacterium]